MKTSFALGLLVVSLAASVAAQDYAIKMSYPLKVGQRFKLTALVNGYSDNFIASERRVIKNEKEEIKIELESEATVLAVDEKGRPTKESHIIVKLLNGIERAPMLARGTKVIASRPDRIVVIEIGDKIVTNELAKVLGLAIDITSGGPNDDDIFGATDRKKIGDTWPVNETLALKDANQKIAGSGLSISSLKGSTTLRKVTKDGGVDVLHLEGTLTARMSPEIKGPFTFVDSTMTATLTGAFPADFTKSAHEEGATFAMTVEASGKPNLQSPMVKMTGKKKFAVTRQFKLLE